MRFVIYICIMHASKQPASFFILQNYWLNIFELHHSPSDEPIWRIYEVFFYDARAQLFISRFMLAADFPAYPQVIMVISGAASGKEKPKIAFPSIVFSTIQRTVIDIDPPKDWWFGSGRPDPLGGYHIQHPGFQVYAPMFCLVLPCFVPFPWVKDITCHARSSCHGDVPLSAWIAGWSAEKKLDHVQLQELTTR